MTIKRFKKTTLSGLIALSLAATGAIANDQISKPAGAKGSGTSVPFQPKNNKFWWPEQLDLSQLRDHDTRSNPLGEDFDYAEAFSKLDLAAVKADVNELLTTSQDWWPADFGNYGPFFIRLAWHSAGTYRTLDGRGGGDGGQMRFDPLNSWPDNASLDKARRLLWPIKQKYGESISWGDLMILAGTVGMENMGFDTYGYAGGRTDDWEPDMVYWGPEVEMLASDREERDGKLQRPLGATHMGLIYVNPEGPKGVPDPMGSAKNIRIAFSRMAMNDEETVALIAGGHTFGKMHGAHKPSDCLGAEPGGAGLEEQGLGWKNKCGKGHSEDTVTSGLEGAWTQLPTKWTSLYLQNLLGFEWKQTRSPAGAIQWVPTDESLHKSVPDAHVEGKRNPPVMTTADLALKYDPKYRAIAERFLADPKEYSTAFAKAWFKLTHRDMGPKERYLGTDIPEENFIWQDPVPEVDYPLIDKDDAKALKAAILDTGLTVQQLVKTAWASASSFRASDLRGGANGARIALEPQISWDVNEPDTIKMVVAKLKEVQSDFNEGMFNKKQVSLADLIVLGGAAAIEKAAADAGVEVTVPFVPGRGDATQAQTDVNSFSLLEPSADAFRNYYNAEKSYRTPTEMLIDKADQLYLTVPEMTVLLGGLRVLDVNADGASHGVFTENPGTLSNDFFVTLLDMGVKWQKTDDAGVYQAMDRNTGKVLYTGTPVDLIFGSNSELRAVAEVYAYSNAKEKFVNDFVKAWTKVMTLDRFDLRHDLGKPLNM
ncbi:peroxidase [Alteromonas australica]|uniref:catalase/peroxidase HPI n=1 Tax=Alteromonas australica TaxID=589873 RepID=UPI0005C3FD55|nr:catalase/peroxidase HPI [Alteromonas australica]MAB94324.1 catalase/peroxidase HPI [Alteromonas sp.]AJP44990.1 peroxidase [Alteromonas australica]MAO29197.1 catalase/peroxidase HPI [Alteromonas sp.]HAI71106.1 catalase/peroxidase HPI [Alteromonas australica]HBF72973.1 catalase/peroxidase HPI [Alteromonas australica]|tara:strand:- start:1 stop:2301 length:2301 start_codon:yes stop_codon:yes gene_type:complete